MEIFFLLTMIGLLTVGPMLPVIAYAVSAELSMQGRGGTWMALTVLLFVLLTGALIAIGLSGLFLTFAVIMFGSGLPSTTEWERFGWLAVPPTKMVAALAATTGAAWLWSRPRGRYASFPIALALVVLTYEGWPQFGH